jgi:hypothetical protein
LEEHIASTFRVGTVSHNQYRYKFYLMFAFYVVHHFGSARRKILQMLVQGMNRLVTLLPLHLVTTEAKNAVLKAVCGFLDASR